MKHQRILLLLLYVFALSNCVRANAGETGTYPPLMGSVSDAISKKPVKGVTIFVTSCDSKIEKAYTTDDFGKFVIPTLGCGEITLVLEKKGYRTFRKERIVVKEGMPVKLNLDLCNEDRLDENLFHPLLRMMDN